ncbi:HK97-gp10 family putative phage morphogenesis protein [Evansella cellulosilytica]|nr:HK97-gp10 family putative phage morphogenesis protein [Evansella cellulosilytica]
MSKPSITVNVEGVGATVTSIGLFNMELRKDLIATVRSTSRAIQQDGKANAPVSKTPKSRGRSGDLRRSIRPKYFDGGLSSTVVPRKPRGSHRHLVAYGTQRRVNKSGANRGRMPKNPFMEKAQENNERKYNNEVRRIVEHDKTI